ncbi:transposable element Tcb2 transposase [Trichonephila clavipes]|nr:transposable element Tcb2 transposase [Trichonephila clavipes]
MLRRSGIRGFYANQSQRTRQSNENLLSKIQSLKYRIQQQYSQNKSQKVFTPSTALRHNYRYLKYTYMNDYSQAITRSTVKLYIFVRRQFKHVIRHFCSERCGNIRLSMPLLELEELLHERPSRISWVPRYVGEGGQTQAEVAQVIGVSQSVISRIWNRILETGSAGRRPEQGHRRKTTPNEDRYLELTARSHRNMNATILQQHLRSAIGTTVSNQTVRNRLHGVGLYARRPMVCVRLTSSHRRDRRGWATEHVNWRRNEWSNVLFSDESRFSVHPDNRRIFIWRDRVSRNNPAFVRESVRFDGEGVWVYGGISIEGRIDLYIIRDGPLTDVGMRSSDLLWFLTLQQSGMTSF